MWEMVCGSAPEPGLSSAVANRRSLVHSMLATAPEKGVAMGQAREAMDRVTKAALSNDFEELGTVYAEDAEAVTPDQGTIAGREAIVAYFAGLSTAFPDAAFEVLHQHETADTRSTRGTSPIS
jgi:ketosteroid isomerase-like protein